MDIESINESILLACIRTDRQVSIELAINHDDSSSMFGEVVYNILLDGEVEDEFYTIKDAVGYVNKLVDTYVP